MSEQTQNPQANPNPEPATNVLETGREAFRARARERLGQQPNQVPAVERDMPNLKQTELPTQDARQDVRQPELDPLPELSDQSTSSDPNMLPELDMPTGEPEETGADLLQPEDDRPPEDLVDWQAKYVEAEDLRQSMESDYRKKTMKLADDRREVKKQLEVQTNLSAVYVQQAEEALRPWANVDWQALRNSLDPAEYNQRVQQYRQVQQAAENQKANHAALVEYAEKTLDENRQAEAEVSREILQNTIPKWGNEVYGALRNHAIDQLGFTQTEFDDITDHKIMKLVYKDLLSSQAGSTVEQLTRKQSQRAPSGANLPPRSPDGKFRKAQQSFMESPGDRNAAREFFRERLRKEREGGRLV